jgi:hypothetical protein
MGEGTNSHEEIDSVEHRQGRRRIEGLCDESLDHAEVERLDLQAQFLEWCAEDLGKLVLMHLLVRAAGIQVETYAGLHASRASAALAR